MNNITIANFPPDLEKVLKSTAEKRGVSLDTAAIHLMRQGAGLAPLENDAAPIGNALDAYFGTWTEDEADALRNATRALDQVTDETFWK